MMRTGIRLEIQTVYCLDVG